MNGHILIALIKLWWSSRMFSWPQNLVFSKCNGLNKSHEEEFTYKTIFPRGTFWLNHLHIPPFLSLSLSLRQNHLQKSVYNASLKTTHNAEPSGTPSKKWIHFFTKPLKKSIGPFSGLPPPSVTSPPPLRHEI